MRKLKFSFRKFPVLTRTLAIVLPLLCVLTLLSQTAFAQNTYVITDGDRVVVHTTYATDPAEVLSEIGLSLDADDTFTTQEGNGVSEILVRRVQTVHIDHCGKSMTVDAFNETVGDLLERLNLETGSGAEISHPLSTKVYDGMALTIHRSVDRVETYTKSIPHSTIYCDDATLPVGTQEVVTQGQDGEMLCSAYVSYEDGQEVGRTVLDQNISILPVSEVIAVGTMTEAAQEAAATGMPVIEDGIITTATGEVLTYTDTLSVVATAYNKSNEGCNDYTATGTLARVGAIAVDPDLIPYGTRMFIVSDDGEYVYGIATAEDCGGDINENRIDLYFDTNEECFQFGRRDCTVYILG